MQSGTCGENLTWKCDYNGPYITLTISGTGKMNDYSPRDWPNTTNAPWSYGAGLIEKVIIKYGVTSIGKYAFRECKFLTSVTIPDSVTFIGEGAFESCHRGFTSVIIPNSVTSIGDSAFSFCDSLTSITIPEGVTSIGDSAFSECESLTSITIPNFVTFIGDSAFRWCKSLTSITIPKSVTFIGDWAFSYCKSLTSITIPESVQSIGDGAFHYCKSLREIHYPAGCGFEDKLREGNNAKLIPYDVTPQPVSKPITQPVTEKLRWKVEGKTLTVGGVFEIEKYSYSATPWNENLRDIQKIIIEDGVEKISARAFEDCTRLEQLIISASVKTIGDFAFTYCYCGDRKINSGKNVIWSLEDGTLMIKKNPAAKSDADFSTGFETWEVAEKNITGVKIERGIVPNKRFFDWLARMGNSVNVSF